MKRRLSLSQRYRLEIQIQEVRTLKIISRAVRSICIALTVMEPSEEASRQLRDSVKSQPEKFPRSEKDYFLLLCRTTEVTHDFHGIK